MLLFVRGGFLRVSQDLFRTAFLWDTFQGLIILYVLQMIHTLLHFQWTTYVSKQSLYIYSPGICRELISSLSPSLSVFPNTRTHTLIHMKTTLLHQTMGICTGSHTFCPTNWSKHVFGRPYGTHTKAYQMK